MRGRFISQAMVRLGADERGAAIIEFALIMPIFLLLTIGALEIALVTFVGSSIEAAVLQASRYGITGSTSAGVTREDRVRNIIEDRTFGFVDMDKVEIDTLIYDRFQDVGEPEPFEDANGNGSYDTGENFTDINGNAKWDTDMGKAGLGADDDIVLYRIRYEWGILTPIIREVLGQSIEHTSVVAVRNEDF
ncbi:MAG: TadE family protein [Pseudomonadota bacterium]